jgi:putative nucleotidyltransferase with HDIG domain
MTQLARDQVQARLKQLPSLPASITDLLASFADEDVDVERIARQIARDQGLTARLLRVANSSFYGRQSRVGTVHEAVVILGFRAVRSTVLAVGMSGVFKVEHCPGFDSAAYLRHAAAVGLAARGLAGLAGHNAELAFTGGILHDIGQLVLAANFPAQYAEALACRRLHDCFMVEAEREVLGIDHAEVGGLLAETWRFPPELHAAVAGHHAPDGSLADLIHLADAVAHALGLARSVDEMVMPIDPAAWQRLGLDAPKLAAVLPTIERDMEETCLAASY